ncbi:hypothetical protein KJ632_00505 [Patescibacteria group bacterium]|nr:hypothetical protein [Patescibacteria group bacterium]
MEVSYNLRYQKSNFSNKMITDKEGEVIIYGKGFRLKGKGAQDKGELINFSEIKEFYYKDGRVIFITFAREKYVLSDMGTLFDQLLVDLYRARNEFLMDALFMKGGKMKAEFEGNFERFSKFGKHINKGQAKVRLYEKSMVVVPSNQDAFSLHYDFVNFHEFDEGEYNLKITMDDGSSIIFSQFGDDFEFFEERLNELLGGMYEVLVNSVLREVFGEFPVATLLKLAYKMKGGKAVSHHDIRKMDEDMAVAVEKFVLGDEEIVEKLACVSEGVDEYNVMYGIAKDAKVKDGFVKWVMYVRPEDNLVGAAILPRWENEPFEMYFYKIIMEKGRPADKFVDKVLEVNQALVVLDFVKDPCFKDKRELKHSPYKYAIRKLPFLRILRKSYAGKVGGADAASWAKEFKEVVKTAKLQ